MVKFYGMLFKRFIISCILFFAISIIANAQNIAPLATVTASNCSTGPCSAFNNLVYGTCGTQEVWVSTSNPPSSTPGTDYIEWLWPSIQSFDEITIHHASATARFLTGGLIQIWNGSTWVNHHTFSNLPMVCINTITFPRATTNRMRITSFQMTGTGQTSNPNFREIEIFRAPTGPNDAGVSSLVSPNSYCVGMHDIIVKVQNFGNNVINTLQVNWRLNGVLQTPISLTLPLDTIGGAGINEREVTLATSYNFTSAPVDLTVWTSLPNNSADTFNVNDTIARTLKPSLAGIYTINSALATSGNNYQSISEFVSDLNSYGVCGPVVANIEVGSGPYTERILLNNVAGTSSVNTIRINGNGETVQFNSTDNTNKNLVLFNGTSYVTIDNLKIKTLSSQWGWGITFTNNANHDSIINCHLDLSSITSTSSANSNGIVVTANPLTVNSSGNNASNIFIGNNLLDLGHPTTNGGAYYGISIYGLNSTVFGADSIFIVNNVIKNYYYYGVYAYYTNDFYFKNNELTAPTKNSIGTHYGFYSYYSGRGEYSGNKIHSFGLNTTSTSSFYPFSLYYPNYSSSIPKALVKVTNNAVYNVGNLGGASYFFRVYGGDSALVAHNTIDVNLPGSTSTSTMYGLYIYNTTNSYFVKNNNVTFTGGNNGTKYGNYIATSTMFTGNPNGLQNNNVYMNSTRTGTQYYAYYGSAYATLGAFQAAYPALEVSGKSEDPLYVNQAAGDLTPSNPNILQAGENLNGLVPLDIKASTRPNPPTIGAWDLAPEDYDNAGIDSILNPSGNFCSSNQEIRVRVRNFGYNDIDTVTVHYTINGVARPPVTNYTSIVGKGSAPYNQAIVTLGTETFYYGINYEIKVWTDMPNNVLDDYNEDDTFTMHITPSSTLPVFIGNDTLICDNVSYQLNAGVAQGYTYVWDNLSAAPTRFIYQAGTYYVTKTDNATGCLGVDTIIVSTKPAPIVNLGPDQSICSGDSMLLDVGSANVNNTIIWSDSINTAQRYVSAAGVYQVTVISANDCSATDEIKITFKDNPTVDGINAILTLDGSYNFNVRNPQFIQYAIWDYGDGSPKDTGLAVNHKFRDNGLYTIKVKLISECLSTIDSNFVYEETLDVFDATSIDKLDKNFIKIYPNPANDYIMINSDESRINVVKVYNAVGQVVLNQALDTPVRTLTLSTQTLSSGVYHIVLKTDVGNYSKKIEVIK